MNVQTHKHTRPPAPKRTRWHTSWQIFHYGCYTCTWTCNVCIHFDLYFHGMHISLKIRCHFSTQIWSEVVKPFYVTGFILTWRYWCTLNVYQSFYILKYAITLCDCDCVINRSFLHIHVGDFVKIDVDIIGRCSSFCEGRYLYNTDVESVNARPNCDNILWHC